MELIEQSRGGNHTAFGRIVRQYQGIVSGVVYGILGDFHKSEDIAQETFLIAWKKLDELRDCEKLPGWLCGIARNLAHQSRLKQAKIPTVPVSQAEKLAETADDPARILAQSEQNRLIWNALEKIPEKYRVPLVLFYRSEQSVPEIAQALELSENTLCVRLSRARKFLRQELEKQVEGAILSNGPGEFFSLAVLAALPVVASVSGTGKAVAATVAGAAVGTEATFAASAMVAAPKPGSTGTALFGTSSWWNVIQPVLGIFLMLFQWFFWILAVVPGIWVSVHNAPTLRARRYLILCSLRIYGLFGLLFFFLFAFFTCQRMLRETGLALVLFGYNNPLETAVYSLVFMAGSGVIGAAAFYLLIVSPFTYRRIVREDSGLIVPQDVPLEESFLSLNRLNQTFFRVGVFLLAAYAFGVICVLPDFREDLAKTGIVCTGTVCIPCGDMTYSQMFLRYYSQLTIAGLFFLLVFRQMHRSFLATVKDAALFRPPLFAAWNTDRPFGDRVFFEWIISFGFFLAAGMIVTLELMSLRYSSAPRFPMTFLVITLLMLGGSFLLAALSTRFPAYRWCINLGGGCLLIGVIMFCIAIFPFPRPGGLPVRDFWESPQSWSLVFGVMLLGKTVFWGMFLLLLYGVWFLRHHWSGKETTARNSRTKPVFVAVFMIGVIYIAGNLAYRHDVIRLDYYHRLQCELDKSPRFSTDEKHLQKQLAIANMLIRDSEPPLDIFVKPNTYRIRAQTHFWLRNYDEAIADYREAIRIWTGRDNITTFHLFIGEAQLAKGEYSDAVNTLTAILEESRTSRLWYGRDYKNILFNRGYAYEKLGDIEAAVKDYTEVIEAMEQHSPTQLLETSVPREGYGVKLQHKFGYGIRLGELKDVRDRLLLQGQSH